MVRVSKDRLKYVLVSDIDGSMMTWRMEHEGATPTELAAQWFIRNFFDRNGLFGVATAQTIEMLLSSGAFARSAERIMRPLPFLKVDTVDGNPTKKVYSYVHPERIACRQAYTDPDFVLSMGTGIFPRRSSGKYAPDKRFKKRLRREWRRSLLALLHAMGLPSWGSTNFIKHLGDIDSEEKYYRRETNVFPNDYRLQLKFADPKLSRKQNEEQKNRAKGLIQSTVTELSNLVRKEGTVPESERTSILAQFGGVLDNLLVVDESRPSKNRFMIYLMALLASKEAMSDEYLKQLSKKGRIKYLFFFGDMPPDLLMGCRSGDADNIVFVLAGGSELTPYLTRGSPEYGKPYAGESLKWLIECLTPTGRPGIEIFQEEGRPSRTVIIGDILYPGLVGPETLAAYLQEFYPDL